MIHLVLGLVGTISFVPQLYTLIILGLGIFTIFVSNNENEEALIFAAYIVGIEVFLRMTRGAISYEIGKYSLMIFLLIGSLIGRQKQKSNFSFVLFILFLLLGIMLTKVPAGESIRKAIAFNLTGPIALGIASLYLFQRPIKKKVLLDILYVSILPVFSMVAYMYYRTPNLSEMVFGTGSNFDTSGGFGPNQVSTILGYGFFVIAIFIILKVKLTGFILFDGIILAYFVFRGLLTFSRGGVITAGVGLSCFLFFYILYKKISFGDIFKYGLLVITFIGGIWLYTSDLTGGMIVNRYQSKDRTGKRKELTTGRAGLFKAQLDGFKEAPLFGIGVGNGKYKRLKEGDFIGTSHNEVSRLIEEHGVLGIIMLLILIINPILLFRSNGSLTNAFTTSFFVIWFLTINHSAMRVAFPAFIYGLCLIRITDIQDEA